MYHTSYFSLKFIDTYVVLTPNCSLSMHPICYIFSVYSFLCSREMHFVWLSALFMPYSWMPFPIINIFFPPPAPLPLLLDAPLPLLLDVFPSLGEFRLPICLLGLFMTNSSYPYLVRIIVRWLMLGQKLVVKSFRGWWFISYISLICHTAISFHSTSCGCCSSLYDVPYFLSSFVQVLEAFLAPGSELWMFNEVPEKEREKKLIDGGLDILGLTNITLVHKEGNAVIRRHLENLPLETFDSVSMHNFLDCIILEMDAEFC